MKAGCRWILPVFKNVARASSLSLLLGGMIALCAAAQPGFAAATSKADSPAPPATLSVRNAALEVTLNTGDATLSVLDRRSQRRWVQRRLGKGCVVKSAAAAGDRLELRLAAPTGLAVTATLQLDADAPEFTVTLKAAGAMPSALVFPEPFTGEAGDYLVVPMNEGISY